MHPLIRIRSFLVATLVVAALPLHAMAQVDSSLRQAFALGAERSTGVGSYQLDSRMTTFSPTGARTGTTAFLLSLRCEVLDEEPRQTCTALEYRIQRNDSDPVSIPSVVGFEYQPTAEADSLRPMFGIDPTRFENLVDSRGEPVPVDQAYHVYNSFIDFHMFDQVLASQSAGNGIEDLSRIGDRIVHEAAFSDVPVQVGNTVKEGSHFRNGEMTLEFKGLSTVDDHPAAIIAYDSGESEFEMIMEPMSGFRVTTTGSSHYRGDFYVDLESNWVRRATLYELVVAETLLPIAPGKVQNIIEREIDISLIDFVQ